MTILEDTGQKKGEHIIKNNYWKDNGVDVVRNHLPFGDYAATPAISVDTKRNMDEIAANIGSEHKRFISECKRAQAAGCKLKFLIENDLGITSIDQVHTWINPRIIYSERCISGDRLEKAMKTIQSRYGCEFHFCSPKDAGEHVLKLLELK